MPLRESPSQTPRLADSRKERQHKKLCKKTNILLSEKPSWAQKVPSQDEEAALDPFLIVDSTRSISKPALLPDHIGIRRHRNLSTSHKSPVSCLHFHPSRPWLLVGRKDGLLSVSEIDALGNTQLFLCKVPRNSIIAAKFAIESAKVILCSSRLGILIWDLEKRQLEPLPKYSSKDRSSWTGLEISSCGKYVALFGRDGHVALLSGSSLATLGEFKMSGGARCCVFDSQRKLLLTAGTEHKLYIWDIVSLKCLKVLHVDSGCAIASLALSPDGAFLVVGTELGVLGLCKYNDIIVTQDTLMRLGTPFMNLVTRISCVRVHPSSELLCFSSPDRARALRIVHLQSLRVFSNWPKDITPIHRVQDVVFDTTGHYMAIGNEKGKVLIYGLSHFQ